MIEMVKTLFLFVFGGSAYYGIELLWRGYSHWSMFLLGGLCFIFAGWQNRQLPLWKQTIRVNLFVVAMEFITGCIVNLWLGWHIWDYSNLYPNILGQTSLLYAILFLPLCALAIIVNEYLRYFLYDEKKPHFQLRASADRTHTYGHG